MRSFTICTLVLSAGATLIAQDQPNANRITAVSLPAKELISEPGPTFRFEASSLPDPLTFIVYGDQRFTDPANVAATNPRVRLWLVNQIAAEHPAAVILNGDVPLSGDVVNDYTVFQSETKIWRDGGVKIFPALGNHEFHGDPRKALQHWWAAFPELTNRRWYSALLGSRLYIIALDSNSSLAAGSDQQQWLEKQIGDLPASVDFVVVTMHHPPVADVQKRVAVDHNPRENEIALRNYLSLAAARSHARFLVSAGHIHNYERNVVDDVVYLVSGGGGARPVYVERTSEDRYQSVLFPNFHYVKFTVEKDLMRGVMCRVENAEAERLNVEQKDSFEIPAKPR